MATARASRMTPAREAAFRVMKADIDRVTAGGESRFPNYSSFIASDLVTDEKIREAHARGGAVVIVDEHEHVTVLPAPDPSIAERESDRFWSGILTHWR
jgi:hypothetical protein